MASENRNEKTKIVGPSKGRHIAVAGDINTIIVSKEDTGGTYSFVEAKIFPGGGPSPHIQTREYEGFYVIEGQVTFKANGQTIVAKPGTFINIPPGVLHSFKNEANEIAKVTFVLSPGGMEQLFVEVGIEVSDTNVKPPTFTKEQIQKLPSIASKYGVEIRPPS